MACSSETSNRKRHLQLSHMEMCKIPKANQSANKSTSHAAQEPNFDISQQPATADIRSVDLDGHEIVIYEADLIHLLSSVERYVPTDCKCLRVRNYGKTHPINLKPKKHWFESYDFHHYVQERDVVICYTCTKTLQKRISL